MRKNSFHRVVECSWSPTRSVSRSTASRARTMLSARAWPWPRLVSIQNCALEPRWLRGWKTKMNPRWRNGSFERARLDRHTSRNRSGRTKKESKPAKVSAVAGAPPDQSHMPGAASPSPLHQWSFWTLVLFGYAVTLLVTVSLAMIVLSCREAPSPSPSPPRPDSRTFSAVVHPDGDIALTISVGDVARTRGAGCGRAERA